MRRQKPRLQLHHRLPDAAPSLDPVLTPEEGERAQLIASATMSIITADLDRLRAMVSALGRAWPARVLEGAGERRPGRTPPALALVRPDAEEARRRALSREILELTGWLDQVSVEDLERLAAVARTVPR